MTIEEAIKELIRAYEVLDFSCHMDNRRKEAFNMAKVALEQEPLLDKIRAEVEKEIIPRDSEQYYYEAKWQNLGLRMALKVIDKYRKEQE